MLLHECVRHQPHKTHVGGVRERGQEGDHARAEKHAACCPNLRHTSHPSSKVARVRATPSLQRVPSRRGSHAPGRALRKRVRARSYAWACASSAKPRGRPARSPAAKRPGLLVRAKERSGSLALEKFLLFQRVNNFQAGRKIKDEEGKIIRDHDCRPCVGRFLGCTGCSAQFLAGHSDPENHSLVSRAFPLILLRSRDRTPDPTSGMDPGHPNRLRIAGFEVIYSPLSLSEDNGAPLISRRP